MVGRMVPVISRGFLSMPTLSARFIRSLQQHSRAPDYYAILGVAKHAEISEIKFAYYNMAKKFHPDTNRTLDAKQMFALVAEAYDVLSDDTRRARYDETGLSEDRFGGTSRGPGRQSTDGTYTAEQMYQTIFGANAREGAQAENAHEDFASTWAGEEVSREYIVQVSAGEAVTGVRVFLQLRLPGLCDKCRGSRSELGYTGALCPYCEGTGQETVRTGHITARKTCGYCNGEKIFIKFKCIECEGIGRKMYELCYPIDIPPGTQHGEVVNAQLDPTLVPKLEHIFGNDPDFASRSLFVTVDVAKSESFTVDGKDIVAPLELSPCMALLGGVASFLSPARRMEVPVLPGTSSHTVIVLPEEGVRTRDSVPGDLVLRTAIKVPSKLSWRQLRIWRKFAVLEPGQVGAVVEGVPTSMDHRLNVNVVTADRISNDIVKIKKVKGMDETFLDLFRTKMGWEKPENPSNSGVF